MSNKIDMNYIKFLGGVINENDYYGILENDDSKKAGHCKTCMYPATNADVQKGRCTNCLAKLSPENIVPKEKGPAPVKWKTVYRSEQPGESPG